MDNYALITKSISLEKYGIQNPKEIIYNPSFEFLYNEELNPNLSGYE
jgi:phosphoenolpyruvate carboxykinase (ATP)